MIGIFILIAIGSAFNNFAKNNGLNQILWVILSIASYYATQIIIGVLIALIDPSILDDGGTLMIISLISGFAGVGIMYLIMRNVASKKVKTISDSEVLDDELLS